MVCPEETPKYKDMRWRHGNDWPLMPFPHILQFSGAGARVVFSLDFK